MATVAELLTQSRNAHEQYRQHQPRHEPTTKRDLPGNPELAKTNLHIAASSRAQAHVQDPKHDDPAWALDAVPHDDLMAFYVAQMAKLA